MTFYCTPCRMQVMDMDSHRRMYHTEEAEIRDLRARLAEVEAERVAREHEWIKEWDEQHARACAAEARLARWQQIAQNWMGVALAPAARGEGDRPGSMGTEICWDCCKTNDHARHREGDRPTEGRSHCGHYDTNIHGDRCCVCDRPHEWGDTDCPGGNDA